MAEAKTEILTIGYQGRTLAQFVEELKAAGVCTLVDVRRRPISRKPGFSKRSLMAAVESVGINYTHQVDLGMPIDLLPLRNEKDNSAILSAYRQRLPACRHLIDDVEDMAHRHKICLLCFEADHTQCHRDILAEELRRAGPFEILHL